MSMEGYGGSCWEKPTLSACFDVSKDGHGEGGGGQGGIRTLDRLTPMLVFETSAFNHSATCPQTGTINQGGSKRQGFSLLGTLTHPSAFGETAFQFLGVRNILLHIMFKSEGRYSVNVPESSGNLF